VSNYYWQRAIMLVDLNAFFASIEQLDFPELRGKPVGVTNGEKGTCFITCSYEARRMGVHTGMRLYEAKKLCPDIIARPSRPHRYAQISEIIMNALTAITPDIETISVDEAFLDITHCQRLHGTPLTMAKMAKQIVYDATGGLHCSVGVSGDKTTAKWAAEYKKPNGLTIVHPSRARDVLAKVPVTELCGIADGIGGFLAKHGVVLCGDMVNIPKSVVAKRYGPLGERIWYMAQGLDPLPVKQHDAPPKSVGHGKVLPPQTKDRKTLLIYFRHMAEKVGKRLRRNNLAAKKYYIGIKSKDNYQYYYIGDKFSLACANNDGLEIYKLCVFFLDNYWAGQGVSHVQVTALDPTSIDMQQDLFTHADSKKQMLNNVIDKINGRYGEFVVLPATLLERSEMPNVIAFNWNPKGVRNSIV